MASDAEVERSFRIDEELRALEADVAARETLQARREEDALKAHVAAMHRLVAEADALRHQEFYLADRRRKTRQKQDLLDQGRRRDEADTAALADRLAATRGKLAKEKREAAAQLASLRGRVDELEKTFETRTAEAGRVRDQNDGIKQDLRRRLRPSGGGGGGGGIS
eukprot:g138.t1